MGSLMLLLNNFTDSLKPECQQQETPPTFPLVGFTLPDDSALLFRILDRVELLNVGHSRFTVTR